MSKRLSIDVSDEQHTGMKVAAAKEGVSITDIVRALVDEYLKDSLLADTVSKAVKKT